MKRSKLRIALITLALSLATMAALLLISRMPQAQAEVVSSTVDYTAAAPALETIADETTPLAGAAAQDEQAVTTIALTQTAARIYAPVQQTAVQQLPVLQEVTAEEPAQQEPVQEAPAQEEPAQQEPAQEKPAQEEPAQEEPAQEEPAQEEPAQETPVVKTTAASRMLERANALLTQLAACTNNAEKRALLDAPNNSLGNDAIRTKLLADLGGSWEQLETEVVDATEYQQDKTLYVQVFIAGKSANYEAVVYTTQNSDRSGNQWATNLVYDDETETWMEYTQKHAYNNSRVGYYVTGLYNTDGAWDTLKDTMETSDVWQEVVLPEETETAQDTTQDTTQDTPPETDAVVTPEA